RDDLGFKLLGEFDQLHVDFANSGIIVFNKLHSNSCHLLDALENVEAATPSIALKRIGRIGNLLQFAEHKVRNDEDSIEESCFANVGNTAIDDHACVEDLVDLLCRSLAAENAA